MIREKSPGVFEIAVYVGTDPLTKKRINKFATVHGGRRAAEKMERQLKSQSDDSAFAPIEARTYESYAKEWIQQIKNEVSPNTWPTYENYIKVSSEYFGKMKMEDIQRHHVAKFLDDLKNGRLTNKKLNNNTVRKYFFVLRKLFRESLENNSPMQYMTPPKPQKHIAMVPSDNAVNMLLECSSRQLSRDRRYQSVTDEDMRLIIALGALCGMRRGEIFALLWSDISDGYISITKSLKVIGKGNTTVGPPKSAASVRRIVIDDFTRLLLEEKRKTEKVRDLTGKIFTVTMDAFEKRFSDLAELTGEPGLTFHKLRHYHLSELYANGFDDLYAAKRAGHDPLVLKGIYQHLGLKKENDQDEKIKSMHKKPDRTEKRAK